MQTQCVIFTNKVYYEMNKLEEATQYYTESLEMREKLQGHYHSKTAIAYTNMGNLLKKQEKLPEAREMFVEALNINRNIYGYDHPIVASDLVQFDNYFTVILED